jgi:hypothetical protein
MNRISHVLQLSVLVMLTAMLAMGQSFTLDADIPFNFELRDRVLQAGDYRVDRASNRPDVVFIRNMQTGERILCVGLNWVVPPNRMKKATPERLVFRRYGNGHDSRYFLAEVWSQDAGVHLFRSSTERQVVDGIFIADKQPQRVVIYAKR